MIGLDAAYLSLFNGLFMISCSWSLQTAVDTLTLFQPSTTCFFAKLFVRRFNDYEMMAVFLQRSTIHHCIIIQQFCV